MHFGGKIFNNERQIYGENIDRSINYLLDSILPNKETVLFCNADNWMGFFLAEVDNNDLTHESLISPSKWLTGCTTKGDLTVSSRTKSTTHFHILKLAGHVEETLGVPGKAVFSFCWEAKMSSWEDISFSIFFLPLLFFFFRVFVFLPFFFRFRKWRAALPFTQDNQLEIYL